VPRRADGSDDNSGGGGRGEPHAGGISYSGAKILITGGTGSIGGELLTTLLRQRPKMVVVFSNDENGLFEKRSEVGRRDDVEFMLGDIREPHSLENAMKDCDYVFHAAALKHVTFCETNPYEAITTNIMGTQNVINSAIAHAVKKFVFISTDKAVNPASTLGATKLLAERLVVSASRHVKTPIFSIVRFGNVIGSRGSVVLIFERQVRAGGPITVTNPGMTRFIMATSQAAGLILRAAEEAGPGDIFVLKMKTVTVGRLAEACRTFFSRRLDIDPQSIAIEEVGMQPGEKEHEELMNETEMASALASRDFYVIKPDGTGGARGSGPKRALSSEHATPMSLKEIEAELARLYDRSTTT
jgi:UDP-N-acetylglucosamine 4,6-dehydratase/5-epimerase